MQNFHTNNFNITSRGERMNHSSSQESKTPGKVGLQSKSNAAKEIGTRLSSFLMGLAARKTLRKDDISTLISLGNESRKQVANHEGKSTIATLFNAIKVVDRLYSLLILGEEVPNQKDKSPTTSTNTNNFTIENFALREDFPYAVEGLTRKVQDLLKSDIKPNTAPYEVLSKVMRIISDLRVSPEINLGDYDIRLKELISLLITKVPQIMTTRLFTEPSGVSLAEVEFFLLYYGKGDNAIQLSAGLKAAKSWIARADDLIKTMANCKVTSSTDKEVQNLITRMNTLLKELQETSGTSSNLARFEEVQSKVTEVKRIVGTVAWLAKAEECLDNLEKKLRMNHLEELEKFYKAGMKIEVPKTWSSFDRLEKLYHKLVDLLQNYKDVTERASKGENKPSLTEVIRLADILKENTKFLNLDQQINDLGELINAAVAWVQRAQKFVTELPTKVSSWKETIEDIKKQLVELLKERGKLAIDVGEDVLRENQVEPYLRQIELGIEVYKNVISKEGRRKNIKEIELAFRQAEPFLNNFPQEIKTIKEQLVSAEKIQQGIEQMKKGKIMGFEDFIQIRDVWETLNVVLPEENGRFLDGLVNQFNRIYNVIQAKKGKKKPDSKEIDELIETAKRMPIDLSPLITALRQLLVVGTGNNQPIRQVENQQKPTAPTDEPKKTMTIPTSPPKPDPPSKIISDIESELRNTYLSFGKLKELRTKIDQINFADPIFRPKLVAIRAKLFIRRVELLRLFINKSPDIMSLTLSFEEYRLLLWEGYFLRKLLGQNLTKEIIEGIALLERVAGEVEEYMSHIFKVRDPRFVEKLAENSTFADFLNLKEVFTNYIEALGAKRTYTMPPILLKDAQQIEDMINNVFLSQKGNKTRPEGPSNPPQTSKPASAMEEELPNRPGLNPAEVMNLTKDKRKPEPNNSSVQITSRERVTVIGALRAILEKMTGMQSSQAAREAKQIESRFLFNVLKEDKGKYMERLAQISEVLSTASKIGKITEEKINKTIQASFLASRFEWWSESKKKGSRAKMSRTELQETGYDPEGTRMEDEKAIPEENDDEVIIIDDDEMHKKRKLNNEEEVRIPVAPPPPPPAPASASKPTVTKGILKNGYRSQEGVRVNGLMFSAESAKNPHGLGSVKKSTKRVAFANDPESNSKKSTKKVAFLLPDEKAEGQQLKVHEPMKEDFYTLDYYSPEQDPFSIPPAKINNFTGPAMIPRESALGYPGLHPMNASNPAKIEVINLEKPSMNTHPLKTIRRTIIFQGELTFNEYRFPISLSTHHPIDTLKSVPMIPPQVEIKQQILGQVFRRLMTDKIAQIQNGEVRGISGEVDCVNEGQRPLLLHLGDEVIREDKILVFNITHFATLYILDDALFRGSDLGKMMGGTFIDEKEFISRVSVLKFIILYSDFRYSENYPRLMSNQQELFRNYQSISVPRATITPHHLHFNHFQQQQVKAIANFQTPLPYNARPVMNHLNHIPVPHQPHYVMDPAHQNANAAVKPTVTINNFMMNPPPHPTFAAGAQARPIILKNTTSIIQNTQHIHQQGPNVGVPTLAFRQEQQTSTQGFPFRTRPLMSRAMSYQRRNMVQLIPQLHGMNQMANNAMQDESSKKKKKKKKKKSTLQAQPQGQHQNPNGGLMINGPNPQNNYHPQLQKKGKPKMIHNRFSQLPQRNHLAHDIPKNQSFETYQYSDEKPQPKTTNTIVHHQHQQHLQVVEQPNRVVAQVQKTETIITTQAIPRNTQGTALGRLFPLNLSVHHLDLFTPKVERTNKVEQSSDNTSLSSGPSSANQKTPKATTQALTEEGLMKQKTTTTIE